MRTLIHRGLTDEKASNMVAILNNVRRGLIFVVTKLGSVSLTSPSGIDRPIPRRILDLRFAVTSR